MLLLLGLWLGGHASLELGKYMGRQGDSRSKFHRLSVEECAWFQRGLLQFASKLDSILWGLQYSLPLHHYPQN